MKIEHIRNGALYYNNDTERVERVIGRVSPVRVLTYWHHTEERSHNAQKLRKATKIEVEDYLEGRDIPTLKRRVLNMITKLFNKKAAIPKAA
jgi:predicted transcriptional regulator